MAPGFDDSTAFPNLPADLVLERLRDLRSEINCRIEHGAGIQKAQGHLEYVQKKLDEMILELDLALMDL